MNKKLSDYKDEVHKCSKCGLCQSVCPVYKVTGNDCSVSRGKFIMLNGILKGDLKLNKNINKYIDMCLKCNACKNFCPSDIDARKIFTTVKSEYFNNVWYSKLVKMFQSRVVFNLFMNLVQIATNLYRFFKVDKIIGNSHVRSILQKSMLGKKIILANQFVGGVEIQPNSPSFTPHPESLKVVYFPGCVNEYVNPRVKNAVENVLVKMGVNVLPANFNCCGVPFLSSGNVEQFKKQAEYNLSQIPDEFDSFLTDCASCQSAFKDYENYIDDERLLQKLRLINEKSVNVVDFVIKNAQYFQFTKKTTFTFHKPCHLENMEFLPEFLSKAKNIEYREMKDYDVCCGLSGEFAMKNPQISAEISSRKAKNALFVDADYVVTSCPACVLGINQGLIENNAQAEVLNFIEFVSLSSIVLIPELENRKSAWS